VDVAEDPDDWPRGLRREYERAADPALPPRVDDVILGPASRRLPHLGDPALRPVQFAEVYARLLAVAIARAEFYGALLAEQFEQAGAGDPDGAGDYDPGPRGTLAALVGNTYDLDKHGEPVATGEAIRALVKLEADERDRAARLARDGIRIGVQAQQVDVMRSYGHTVVTAMRSLCQELGMDWTDETTRRAAQRAIIAARSQLGAEALARGSDGASG